MTPDRWSRLDTLFHAVLGLAPERRAAFLEESCGDDPSLRQELESLLALNPDASSFLETPALYQNLGAIRPPLQRDDRGSVPTSAPEIESFEILSLLGEGGMGLVYEAEQQNPRRKVALKVVRAGWGFDDYQTKLFHREVQALARLRHPGIAAIYQAGRSRDGRHYFAMELIRGQPLGDFVRSRQLPIRDRLALFLKVCDAVNYAHQHGVIHRDLKPSNIMIDSEGVPKVLDFGLARVTDSDVAATTVRTDLGRIQGTLAYMSPEQALGDPGKIDLRSDVYSLGVICYELLTGQLPYQVSRAPIPQALRIILEHPPCKPSTILRSLRGDLETIALKALEKDPERRYQHTTTLAEDLQRFLAHQPILARRTPPTQRMWRWCRRNPALAAVTGLAVAVFLLGFAGITWQWQVSRQNADLAEKNFQKARDAVDQMLTEVGEQSLENVPHMTPVRKALLEKALSFYLDLAGQRSDDPDLRLEIGRAWQRVADITRILGDLDRSRAAHGQAVAVLDELSSQFPNVPEYRRNLAGALFSLGVLLKNEIEDKAEALKAYRRAIDLRATLVAEFPNVPAYRRELAHNYTDLGLVLGDLDHHDESVAELRQGLALRQQLADEFPAAPVYREDLAHAHHWLGSVLMKTNKLQEAEEHFRACMTIREAALAEPAAPAELRADLAHIQMYLGQVLMKMGRAEEAAEEFFRGVANGERMIEGFPNIPEYRKHLAVNLGYLSEALVSLGRLKPAEQAIQNSIIQTQYLVSNFPDSSVYRRGLAWRHYHLAEVLFQADKREEARSQFEQAFADFEEVITRFPKNAQANAQLGWVLLACPDPQLRDPHRAATLIEKAIELKPHSPDLQQNLGYAYCCSGRWKDAADALSTAPKDGYTWFILAMVQSKLGNKDQARLLYDEAIAWTDENGPLDDNLKRLRAEAQQLSCPPTANGPLHAASE
jgi:tetratricopeptide (TPR) repeat protein/predicted Ser/Thr protein kinase